jgi:hypothetical protein
MHDLNGDSLPSERGKKWGKGESLSDVGVFGITLILLHDLSISTN